MAYDEKPKGIKKSHELALTGREKLSLSGVEDVTGFDENLVVLLTAMGELTVHGSGLHVERIDLEAGVLELRGIVQALSYSDGAQTPSIWKRMFG